MFQPLIISLQKLGCKLINGDKLDGAAKFKPHELYIGLTLKIRRLERRLLVKRDHVVKNKADGVQ
jgi:hypothetical protein